MLSLEQYSLSSLELIKKDEVLYHRIGKQGRNASQMLMPLWLYYYAVKKTYQIGTSMLAVTIGL
jgi:hypothetical protein